MKYFFELGNNPSLSSAEIAAIFGMDKQYQLIGGKILIADLPSMLDAKSIIKKIGGTIKIGVLFEIKIKNTDLESILPFLEDSIINKTEKICFGISYYGRKKFNSKYLGMDIKSLLKERGNNCRWVCGKENILSSVIVEQNKLINKGFELIIIEVEDGFLFGKTLAVQPFKELSARDYGRPARDDHSGMLPPKLAQIMINIASKGINNSLEIKLLDPFCGSGTIITEAMIMGYKNILGSDLSARAVTDTKNNISWILRRFSNLNDLIKNEPDIRQIDSKKIAASFQRESISLIVTEPYLGPQRGLGDIFAVKKELENLYQESLKQLNQILKTNGRVVIIFPIFNQKQKMHFVNIDLSGFKIVNPLPCMLQKEKTLKLSFRQTIVYGREGQRVWREIVTLEKCQPY